MDEEQLNETSPPQSTKLRVIKALTLALVFITVFLALGFVGVEKTSSSQFCSSCHEMKPEYYTWKASSHSEVECVQCHIGSSAKELAEAKANGLVELYKKHTNTYTAPIRMPDEVPDSSCEKCHNVFNRNFTVTGDIIIPHDKHKEEEVSCVQCHSGTAHGNIDDRKMTFQTDYENWDETIGKTAMSEIKFVKPNMDTCMDCHKAKEITTECSACHTTGMIPDSHNETGFANGNHGQLAKTDLQTCNDCHKDMSTVKLEGFDEPTAISKYLKQDNQVVKKSHIDYSKENSYCVDCHNKRPASHTSNLLSNHGTYAKQNKESCSVCHEVDSNVSSSQNKVSCSSCHSKSHRSNWQTRHPFPVTENQKITETCYTCHVKKNCTSCHK